MLPNLELRDEGRFEALVAQACSHLKLRNSCSWMIVTYKEKYLASCIVGFEVIELLFSFFLTLTALMDTLPDRPEPILRVTIFEAVCETIVMSWITSMSAMLFLDQKVSGFFGD